jgi:hypothetical protein
MTKAKFFAYVVVCLAVFAMLESLASAQSTISGVVRETRVARSCRA